jgi:hypothetical protein
VFQFHSAASSVARCQCRLDCKFVHWLKIIKEQDMKGTHVNLMKTRIFFPRKETHNRFEK